MKCLDSHIYLRQLWLTTILHMNGILIVLLFPSTVTPFLCVNEKILPKLEKEAVSIMFHIPCRLRVLRPYGEKQSHSESLKLGNTLPGFNHMRAGLVLL